MDYSGKDHRQEILKVRNVSKWFGGISAVNQVSLTLFSGERRALIGPNGAGKTTLFNVIAGSLRASQGTISLLGRDVTRKSVRTRALCGLGRSYQISNLFLSLSVEENLFLAIKGSLFPSPFSRWKTLAASTEKLQQIAEQVGLTENLNERVKELSHGQQRQLELGMAIASDPKLVLLDEPAAGLSALERNNMLGLIQKLDPTVTLLMVEHDMDIVLGVAERITVMHQGSVIAEGTPREIRADQRVQQIYMGETESGQPVVTPS